MKHLYTILTIGLLCAFNHLQAQVTITTGSSVATTQLIPFGNVCINNGTTTVSVCGINASFLFTNGQCCPCPTSGQVCAPGSVAYGGPGSSGSFLNYHTLSYSPSNENQRLTFSGKITKFQWSASGPAGAAEPFQIQVYDGAALVGNFSFTVPGTGLRNTYYVSGPQFDRIDFIETNAISADDELFGDFRVATAGCPLALGSLNADLAVLGQQKVKIHWTTENEANLSHHSLMRSADGQNWETIDEQVARNAGGPNHYSYIDAHALIGVNYYRIVTLADDGMETFSNVVETQFAAEGNIKVNVYPSPAADRLYVNFAGLEGKKELSVVNQLGQTVFSTSTDALTTELSMAELSNAIYYLVVRTPVGVSTERFEVRK